MHEVLKTAIDYVFTEVGLHRIMAAYVPQNERSARLLVRLGFERESAVETCEENYNGFPTAPLRRFYRDLVVMSCRAAFVFTSPRWTRM